MADRLYINRNDGTPFFLYLEMQYEAVSLKEYLEDAAREILIPSIKIIFK